MINKIENKIKFKVFGQTKLKVKQSKANNDKNINEKNEILLNVQAKKIENEIQRIKQLKQGRATNVFKLRDVINGPKKAAQDPVAFKNQDGELIVHPEQIMNLYCPFGNPIFYNTQFFLTSGRRPRVKKNCVL